MNKIKDFVRQAMYHIAGFIDYWTKSRVKPAHITALSLAGHIPVAWALATYRPVLAAILLAFFGIMDSLDGAMARYQKSANLSGMFFDAVSDRLKEVILYSALAVYGLRYFDREALWMIVALCGTSILVSYTKSKGEMAVSGNNTDPQKLNRTFSVGLATYEIRMAVIITGLLFGILEYLIPILIAANLITIALRYIVVSKELYDIDQENLKKKSKK